MHAVYDFVTEYKQNYYELMNTEIDVFIDICDYLSKRNRGEKKLTSQQKDMIARSKEEKIWEKQK